MVDSALPFAPLQGSQSIETPGVLRSNGTMPTLPETALRNDQQATNGSMGDTTLAMLQSAAKNSYVDYQGHQAAQAALDKISNAGNIPFMTHAISVMAALSGNFGPAMQIQEQKRKAIIGKELAPVTNRAYKLIAEGKYDDVIQLMDEASTKVGPQAPEIAGILKGISDRVSTKQIQLSEEKNLQEIMARNIPKGNINRKAVEDWGTLLEGNKVLGPSNVGMLMAKLVPHIQYVNDQAIQTSLISGETSATPLPAVFDPATLKGTVGERLQGEVGATVDQITNTMRGGPPLIVGDKAYTKEDLQQRITRLQGEEGQMTVAGRTSITPEYAVALSRLPNMTPLKIAMRDITPDERVIADENQRKRNIELAQAPVVAANMMDPTKLKNAGLVVVNGDTQAVNFGRETDLMTVEEARSSGHPILREKILDDKVTPALRALDGFNYLRRMYEAMSTQNIDGSFDYSRLGSGIITTVEKYLKTSLTAGTPIETVMRLIVDRSVEDLEHTGTVDSEMVRRLKNQLIGAFADPKAAIAAVGTLQERVRSDVSRFMMRNSTEYDKLPKDVTSAITLSSPTAAIHAAVINGAKQRGIDPITALNVITQESGFNPKAVGKNGDRGLGQITESTAKDRGLNWDRLKTDPQYNLDSSLDYLAELLKKRGPTAGLIGYNGRPEYIGEVTRHTEGSKKIVADNQAASTLAPIVPATSTSTTYQGNLKGIPKASGVLQ